MMRYPKAAGVVAALLALLIIGGVWYANSAAASSVPAKKIPPPLTQRPLYVTLPSVSGNPAIKPHLAQNGSGPAFTMQDAVAFFASDNYTFFSGPLVPGARMTFLTIQFVPASKASQLMYGESVGRPDDYLVCYIKVEGPFQLTWLHVPQGTHLPASAKYGDAVFDAHTGNLLVWGVYFS